MDKREPGAPAGEVLLRDVAEADLLVFYEQQLDPEACRMAAFPPKEREAFLAHWAKILADETVFKQTVLYGGQVAGNLVSFVLDGEREVGYWIGKEFWGRGVATRALQAFLEQIETRPLYAHVARHNLASRRVLEKCGFRVTGDDPDFSRTGGEQVEGWILRLDER
jgi:RimJ/RimL family protein N-acetyltransferase